VIFRFRYYLKFNDFSGVKVSWNNCDTNSHLG
jgi:hypothetical protein